MYSSRAIRAFKRRLLELGCPARYAQRSIDEFSEHFEDLTQARIEDGLEPETAGARAAEEMGQPAILAEQLVASFRQASWWGRHPVIGFCLLPPLALMLLLPATVLALYALFLLGNIFSHHPIPLNEFKAAVAIAPAAFAEWDNPLMWLIHSVPIAVNTIVFCKLVVRSASGMKWLLTTCAVCSATGFFTWTGFSLSGFYLGYGAPSVYNWISAAVPLFIATLILVWRRYRLALIGVPHEEGLQAFHEPWVGRRDALCRKRSAGGRSLPPHPSPLPWGEGAPKSRSFGDEIHGSNAHSPNVEAFHEPSNEHAAPTELENGKGGVGSYRHGAPTQLFQPVQGQIAYAKQKEAFHDPCSSRRKEAPFSSYPNDCEPNAPAKQNAPRPWMFVTEQWFTPTSAVAAAVVVLSLLFIKFIWLNDKVDHAKMETLRNRVWPAEREGVLDLLQMRQSVKETIGERTIPLLPFATALLTEPVCWFGKTNFATLADLPRGLHTFAGVPFAISERVQLMGNAYKDLGMAFPSAIKGVPINQKCTRLYILHGASFLRTRAPSIPDEQGFLPVLPVYETPNLPIARLVLHYADRRQIEIEIFSTQHLLDVWGPICTSEVPVRERCVSSPQTELAWASSRVPDEKSEMLNSVRLYKSGFENPWPGVEILTIDYISTRTEAAPFMLGLTIE